KNLQQLKDYNAKMRHMIGEGGSYTMKAAYEPGVMLGNSALGFGSTEERVVTNEHHEYTFSSRWTALVTKQDGAWELLRVHVSMDPLQNVFVKTFSHRESMLRGEIAGAFGLLIGVVIGYRVRSRKV